MKSFLLGLLAVVIGLVIGGALNMGLVVLGPRLIPPPPGVNVTSAQSLAASIHLFEPKHFLFPFLAHALGTLAAATIASLIAIQHRWSVALPIGLLFLVGGIAAASMIPAPTWFICLDLVAAYLPMAALGALLAGTLRTPPPASQAA